MAAMLATMRTVGSISRCRTVLILTLCSHQQYEHIIKPVRSVKLRHVELAKIAHFPFLFVFSPSLDRVKEGRNGIRAVARTKTRHTR